MRKRQRRGEDQAQAIDLTPMLDVVFIMLIFFIVTASFIKTPGIDISRTSAPTSDPKKPSILVAINSNNEIWIDKNLVDPDDIKIQLIRLHTENPKGGLIIQADNGSSLESVGLVADTALEIGLTDVAVSTLTE